MAERRQGRTGTTVPVAAIAALMLIVSAATIWARDTRITTISIEGLQRTRERTVLDILPVSVGDEISDTSIELIRNELIDSGIFAEVEVRVDPIPGAPDESELVVILDEKWTLVPVPFFSTNGETSSGGLILIESNLFGRNKQLIAAGTIGTDGFGGFLLFVDPSIRGSRWNVSTNVATGRDDTEALLTDGTLVRRYEFDRNALGIGIGYKVHPDVNVRAGLGLSSIRLIDYEAGLDEREPEDTVFLEPEVRIEYDGTVPLDVLRRGPEAETAFRYVTEENGWELRGMARYNFGIAGYQRLRILAAGGFGDMPTLAETDISSRDGFRTVPYQATRADDWGSGAIAYDLPVLRGGWGALVLSHYWEAGSWDSDAHARQFFYGPGAAFRVYIRQVAIPALGIDYAYNLESSDFVFSLTVGARM